jgi:hypothetical protein
VFGVSRRPPPKGDEQLNLFVAVFADVPIRDQRDMMERPFFSLSKKPRLKPIEYRVGDTWVRVSTNPDFGMASIWDSDILIWAATQLTEAHDRGSPVSPVIKFHPYELLRAVRRATGGKEYRDLRAALQRLTHTAVQTNIRVKGNRKFASFHWLESWTEVVDEASEESRGMTITLPLWLYQGILEQGGVLTIHEDYFLLTGGVERWLYRVARKHFGLDSAYEGNDRSGGKLSDMQAGWATTLASEAAANGQRVILFSHHQPFSLYDNQGPVLAKCIQGLLNSGRVFAWYWGHEHRCVIFERHPQWQLFGRCIGHGGFPYFRDIFPGALNPKMNPDGSRWITLVTRNTAPTGTVLDGRNPYIKGHEEEYGPNGYATLEFSDDHMNETIHAPDGTVLYERQLI